MFPHLWINETACEHFLYGIRNICERIDTLPASPPFRVRRHIARRSAMRAGIGVNIDYNTRTKQLSPVYGHKPQSIESHRLQNGSAQRRDERHAGCAD